MNRRIRCHGLAVVAWSAVATSPVFGQSFTDVTAAAGLYSPVDHLAITDGHWFLTAGFAVGDYDGDGWDDIFMFRGTARRASLFHNDGDGTFTDVAQQAGLAIQVPGSGAVWGDIDRDGDLDLFLSTFENQVFVATPSGFEIGLPAGGATPIDEGDPPYGTLRNYLFINEGDGTFTENGGSAGVSKSGRYSAAFGDLDLDGWLDLVTVSHNSGTNAIFRNRGDGTFEDRTPAFIRSWPRLFTPRLVDYDADGDTDMLIAGDFGRSRLFRNEGDWVFTDRTDAAGVGLDENGMGAAMADVDRDGDLDWFVTAIWNATPFSQQGWGNSGNRLYRNESTGAFSDVTLAAGVENGGWGWGASFADLDNDADEDLVMVNGWDEGWFASDPARAFANDGSGVFVDEAEAWGLDDAGNGRGLATFDFDRDGDLDVLMGTVDDGLVLYRNDGVARAGAHWLEVRLVATQSAPNGVGAIVRVNQGAGAPRQMRVIECGSNYLSQGPMSAWFGLGEDALPPGGITVRIEWPAGITDVQRVTDVDQRLVFVEPSSR